MKNFNEILKQKTFSQGDIIRMLSPGSPQEEKDLFFHANAKTESLSGNKVYFRGLIEFSNHCEKNCLYCGLRKDNRKTHRYMMSKNEIIEAALWAHENSYGSIVLQSGEITSQKRVDFIADVISEIKNRTQHSPLGLGITLCMGELSHENYEKLFKAGAHRYLLRIESSNHQIYKRIHPHDHDFNRRIQCLKILQDIGYQTGTGVMIGLPEQTLEDLADDILFFHDNDIDMIGMGPYLIHNETPLGEQSLHKSKSDLLNLSLRMIATTRLVLKDVNIAATTALQAISPHGREDALCSGANVLMPTITPKKYRKDYIIYEDKPCVNDTAVQCQGCLKRRLKRIGKEAALNKWGDPIHYFNRTKKENKR